MKERRKHGGVGDGGAELVKCGKGCLGGVLQTMDLQLIRKITNTDSLFLNELGVSNINIDAEMYERMLDKLINSHPSKIT